MAWHLLFCWDRRNGNLAVHALHRGGHVWLGQCPKGFGFALGSRWVKSRWMSSSPHSTDPGEFIIPGKLDNVGIWNDASKTSWGFPVIVPHSSRWAEFKEAPLELQGFKLRFRSCGNQNPFLPHPSSVAICWVWLSKFNHQCWFLKQKRL